MASSSATRGRLACDACDACAWVGPRADGYDVWCESCQSAWKLAAAPGAGVRCERCDVPLGAWPRFVELWGGLQHLDAVLGAWAGDASALMAILPERPRFLTDLTPPPARTDDPPARAGRLAALGRGAWRAVLEAPSDADSRALAACAIAHERLGDTTSAIKSWDAVLAAGEDARARLARGALKARAGPLAEAVADLALAGDTFEARWNRAAAMLHEAVRSGEGVPDAGVLSRARAEAGLASDFWSDPTVGRLMWSLLVERELARGSGAPATLEAPARAALRAAEADFEHATFWDRAMVLAGWARLGASDEATRVAAPLARELAAALLDEPALSGVALLGVTQAVAEARSAMDMSDPAEARHALAEPFAREDLRRFRIPCVACGRGTLGIEETAEVDDFAI